MPPHYAWRWYTIFHEAGMRSWPRYFSKQIILGTIMAISLKYVNKAFSSDFALSAINSGGNILNTMSSASLSQLTVNMTR